MKCNQKKIQWAAMVVAIFLLMLPASNAASQESSAEGVSEAEESRNRLALFLGNTQDGSKHGFSIGLEYEYRWSRLFGVGAMVSEYAFGDHNELVIGMPLFLHPYAGWFFLLMPGLEIGEEETSFMGRAGVGYDFEIAPKWELAPEFNVDFIEGGESKLIYGLAISRKF